MKRVSKEQYYLDIAYAVSKRSPCLKRHYGCIIVKNDEIIATGYNGNPRNENNCCDMFEECPRKNVPHNSGNYSDCHSVHAEMNAMLSASRKDIIGSTMYLAGEEFNGKGYVRLDECKPCPICQRMINNSGIVKVVGSVITNSCLSCSYHMFSDFYLECTHPCNMKVLSDSNNVCKYFNKEI